MSEFNELTRLVHVIGISMLITQAGITYLFVAGMWRRFKRRRNPYLLVKTFFTTLADEAFRCHYDKYDEEKQGPPYDPGMKLKNRSVQE